MFTPSGLGSQDLYLTGDPSITFFKTQQKRHTPFALQHVKSTLQGTSDFGNLVTAPISRSGDLLLTVWVEVTLPALVDYEFVTTTGTPPASVDWVDNVGLALIRSAECWIGGTRIERIVPEFADIYAELSETNERLAGYRRLTQANPASESNVSIPLRFYFFNKPDQAIPMCALTMHDVRITVEFARFETLIRSTGVIVTGAHRRGDTSRAISLVRAEVYSTFVQLDASERQLFQDTHLEYLVEITQYLGPEAYTAGTSTRRFELGFSHPCKEIIFVYQTDESIAANSLTGNRHFDYTCPTPSDANTQVTGGPTTAYTVRRTNVAFDQTLGTLVQLPNPAGTASAACTTTITNALGAAISSNAFRTQVLATSITVEVAPGAHASPLTIQCVVTAAASTRSDNRFTDVAIRGAKLSLLGSDQFQERDWRYFTVTQPFMHHTRVPNQPIYVYSFALQPEQLQPSGTNNFSRVDNAVLICTFAPHTPNGRVKIFARSYNVLRVANGVAGLVYSSS